MKRYSLNTVCIDGEGDFAYFKEFFDSEITPLKFIVYTTNKDLLFNNASVRVLRDFDGCGIGKDPTYIIKSIGTM